MKITKMIVIIDVEPGGHGQGLQVSARERTVSHSSRDPLYRFLSTREKLRVIVVRSVKQSRKGHARLQTRLPI